MKLQILVPQYKEDDSVIKPLLDSINVQQSINLSEDIGVIICNDGSDVKLSDSLLNSYPFKIDYYLEEHQGVSATRNACLDKATAEYVMFCDADDMFCSAMGLYIIIREMGIGQFDSLVSVFTEETRDPSTGSPLYINREMDSTFVHGKVHRRQFLIDNNIRWNDELTIHEDSYFNCLCQKLAKELKYCPVPFYLWKWRDDSVCRHDPLYLNRTYVNMLQSNSALVRQFLRRSRKQDAMFYAASMVYDTYYSLNHDRFWTDEGKDYLYTTEVRFKEYWGEFKDLFNSIDDNSRKQIIMGIKNRFFGEGLFLERITFDDWIKHIEELNEV